MLLNRKWESDVPGDHSRYVPRIGFCRARNRIEATETEYFLGCDRVGFYRTQIQAGADCRDAEHGLGAK
jgi:hypothetical protein